MTAQTLHIAPLQTAIAASRAIVHQVETARTSMLITHGLYKILVGAGIIAAGADAFRGPTYRFLNMPTLAVLALLGGATLLVGVARHLWWLQLAGLVTVLLFDFSIAVGFGAAFVAWTGPRSGPAIYPIFIYMHLATIMAVHSLSILAQRRLYRSPGGAAGPGTG